MNTLEQKQDEISALTTQLKSNLVLCAKYKPKEILALGGYTAIIQQLLEDAKQIEEKENEEDKMAEEMEQKMQEQQEKLQNEMRKQQEAQQAMEQQQRTTEKKSKKNKSKEHTKILN